jgi:AhpD family alkylhydroperoxidase
VNAPSPRIAPGSRADVGLPAWGFLKLAGRVTGGQPPNLFATLGRHRPLFRAWLWFGGRMMPGGKLPRRDTELVILRVAHLRDCEYERDHHVRIGKRAGLTDADLARIADGPSADGWSEPERALLTAVDELHSQQDLSDATWDQLAQQYDERRLIELVFLVGHYEMLATFIGTLRIQRDHAG